jgi:dipeptidyl aminopeptidase/acylaminoacyl peptidase
MHRRPSSLLAASLLLIALVCAGPLRAEERGADGALIEAKPYEMPAFEALPQWAQKAWGRETYDSLRSGRGGIEVQHFIYWSGGLRVGGVLFKPAGTAGTKLPVVLWNHGGLGPESRIGATNVLPLYEMSRFAQAGFVVVASQYRGIGGSEGKEEVGGGDVDDVLNLVPLVRALPSADASRLSVYGISRGALVTLQALRRGLPVQAAAVVGSVTDYSQLLDNERIGELARAAVAGLGPSAIEARSPIRWAGELTRVPLLVIHGGADTSIPPLQILDFVRGLETAKGFYELVLYAGDDHLTSRHLDERLQKAIEWFRNPPARGAS